jgi:hypothetical protein
MLVEVFNDLISPVLYLTAHVNLLVAQLISGRYAENGLIVEEDDSLVPCVSDEDFMLGFLDEFKLVEGKPPPFVVSVLDKDFEVIILNLLNIHEGTFH